MNDDNDRLMHIERVCTAGEYDELHLDGEFLCYAMKKEEQFEQELTDEQ